MSIAASATTFPESLLSEIERQEQYLAELPETFEFPLFSGKQAIESQRRSGYKTTARAAREIVDNAVEAGAKNVWVAFRRYGEDPNQAGGHKDNSVSAVAFIDDGPGMSPKMARFALTWGGGTHVKNPGKIGRFGFGLPNSGINQTRLLEVYTKTQSAAQWSRAALDIRNLDENPHALLKIPEPTPAALPAFVQKFLKTKGLSLRSGTVVVWEKPDRLTFRKASTLKEHLVNDFGVVYRGLLDAFSLFVEEKKVDKVDPLFLTPGALYYKPTEDGGAKCVYDQEIPVKYFQDEETGEPRLERLPRADLDELEAAKKDPKVREVGALKIRISRFPVGFVLGEKKHQGKEEYKRFAIRKPRRGMSFVRSGREIDTLDAFPKGSGDEAKGLGDWPTLESYAYHWGIEVHFRPALDDVFALGNDKQTVYPIEDFWRVLAKEEIDKALQQENKEQQKLRDRKKREKAAKELSNEETVTPAIEAAAQAAQVMVREERLPEERRVEARQRHEEEVKHIAEERNLNDEEARKAIEEEAKRKPYAIKLFESEGGVFYKPDYGNGMQRVVMLNKAHPFFQSFYAYLMDLPDSTARNAVDILLFALAEGEMNTEGQPRAVYEHHREQIWSAFLKLGLKFLDQVQPNVLDEGEGEDA